MNLDELKAFRDARDARVSENGTTKEQREILERFASVDVLSEAITIADDLKRQLAEAQNSELEVRHELSKAYVDNAALIEMLDRTEEHVPKDSMEYGDAVILLSQPHPGQALLREIDDRREKMQASYVTGPSDEVTVYGTNADIDGLRSYFHQIVGEREAARAVVEAARTCREESEMIDETEGNVGGYCYIDGVTVLEDALDAYDAVKEAGDA